MAVGDIILESGLHLVTFTAAEDITKGDIVTLATGEIADITAAEVGPFGMAIADVLSGAEGQAAVMPTTVILQAGTAGCTKFTLCMPSEDTGEEGDVVDVSTPVFNEVVGLNLETATVGNPVKVRLGYH